VMDLPVKVDFATRKWPHCVRCNRPVDFVEWETPVTIVHGYFGSAAEHTGEVILTFRCHGETFKISNWRGVVEEGRRW
jgi:hypothetical protein